MNPIIIFLKICKKINVDTWYKYIIFNFFYGHIYINKIILKKNKKGFDLALIKFNFYLLLLSF